MVSYLVMKNNLKREFMKKQTFLILLLMPILIIIFGVYGTKLQEKTVRVGILGGEEFYQECQGWMQNTEGVLTDRASEKSLHTDVITGKYHFVLCEGEKYENEKAVEQIKNLAAGCQLKPRSATERMVAMIVTVLMVLATMFAAKVISDRKSGVTDRYCCAGHGKISYILGYLASTAVMAAILMSVMIVILKGINTGFELSWEKCGVFFLMGTALSALFGVCMALISHSDMMANILGSSAAVLLSILGGTFVAIENMPAVLKLLSVISPVTWVMQVVIG